MGLSQLLAQELKGAVGDPSDEGWRIYILDHLDYIASRSKTYEIDAALMNLYRYDLSRFLNKFLFRNVNITWIVQLLNSLHSDLQFSDIKFLIVPEDRLIVDLYHSYISIKANTNK